MLGSTTLGAISTEGLSMRYRRIGFAVLLSTMFALPTVTTLRLTISSFFILRPTPAGLPKLQPEKSKGR